MNCGICNCSIKRKEPSVSCMGICARDFHHVCVKSSLNFDPLEHGSASFRCEQCTRRRSTLLDRSSESSQEHSHLDTSTHIEASPSSSRFTIDDVMRQLQANAVSFDVKLDKKIEELKVSFPTFRALWPVLLTQSLRCVMSFPTYLQPINISALTLNVRPAVRLTKSIL